MTTIASPAAALDPAEIRSPRPLDLRVFLAYENLAAALRAVEMIAALRRHDPEGLRIQFSPWSFAVLANTAARCLAAPCLQDAHLIVIAAIEEGPLLPPAVEDWLRTGLAQRSAGGVAMAALFGCEGRADRADSTRLRTVQRLAEDAGCAFFAAGLADMGTCRE